MGLRWDIRAAEEKLVHGEVKEIALGLATPVKEPSKARYFLSVAGAGPDGMIVYSIDLELKARLGIFAYWWQGVREVFRYKFPHFRVVTGGKKNNVSLPGVGRTKHYCGPFPLTHRAGLLAPQIRIIGLSTQRRFCVLIYFPSASDGQLG